MYEEMSIKKRVVCCGSCQHADCDCFKKDGLDPEVVGYPPYHDECHCYVKTEIGNGWMPVQHRFTEKGYYLLQKYAGPLYMSVEGHDDPEIKWVARIIHHDGVHVGEFCSLKEAMDGAEEAAARQLEIGRISLMAGRRERKRITICGSSKYIDIIAACKWLIERNEGAITFGMNLLPQWYNGGNVPADHNAEAENCKDRMDELHRGMIDVSHEIFVVDWDGYIGSSTSGEIKYAESKGIFVRRISSARETWIRDEIEQMLRTAAQKENTDAE